MNVEIGTEAAQFREKEYINGILVALYYGAHTVKKLFDIPVPSRDVTYQTLSG